MKTKNPMEMYIEEWKRSGKTIKSYCLEKGIPKDKFDYLREMEIRDKTILSLREMFVNLRRTHFGSKSERFKEDERQGYIFNEIELGLHDEKELFIL